MLTFTIDEMKTLLRLVRSARNSAFLTPDEDKTLGKLNTQLYNEIDRAECQCGQCAARRGRVPC